VVILPRPRFRPSRRSGRRSSRLILLALAFATLLPARLQAQAGQTEVVRVRFEGNEAFPDDSLARAIVTRATECRSVFFSPFCWVGAGFAVERFYLREREIPNDRARLQIWYQRRGFREIQVDTTTVVEPDGGAVVSFRIDEGRPIIADSIVVTGVGELPVRGLLDRLPIRAGDRLSVLALDATRDTLTQRLANQGYARVEVLRSHMIPSDDPYRARVTFEVTPGPLTRFGRITIEGNEQLSETTVLRTIQFKPGDIFRRRQLLDAQARLFGLEILRSAEVAPDFDAGIDSVIPVHVRIQEGDVYRVRYGAGWSTSECLDAEARWASRNFRGGGRILQLRSRVSNILAPEFGDLLCPQGGRGDFAELNWLAAIDFAQPWIRSTRNSLTVSLVAERQSLRDVFIRRAVGLQFSLSRALAPQTPLTLSYRPELSRLDAAEILFCTGFLVCAPDDVSILESANWLAPVGLNLTRNRANNILNPTRGYSVVLDMEHAARWTGSNFRYDRVLTEGTWYASLGGARVLATRAHAGWVGARAFSQRLRERGSVDVVHPQKRFYAGGANSVRGFAQSRLGPRVLTVETIRLLRSAGGGGAGCTPAEVLDLSCDASALSDGAFISRPTGGTRVLEGNVEFRFGLGRGFEGAMFTDAGQVWGADEKVSLSGLEVTPGVGVRYLSPIGPIRLDLAYRFRNGQKLSVVTTQIRPFDPSRDEEADRISVNGVELPFVRTADLAVLGPQVLFGRSAATSFSRFQLHISIGQAF
jgi:outer membrane protein assembly factor BamA